MGLKKKMENGFFKVMLVEDGTKADLDRENYVAELKVDGGRCVAERNGNGLRLYSRRGLLYNETLPDVFESLSKIRAFFLLDGEMTYIDSEGKMIFKGAMKRLQTSKKEKIERCKKAFPLTYFVWDILQLNGEDLTNLPYAKRRIILEHFIGLQKALLNLPNIRLIPMSSDKQKLFKFAMDNGFEGIVLKNIFGKYHSGKRTNEWLKYKIREHTIYTLENEGKLE